jgi:hypothetical protein
MSFDNITFLFQNGAQSTSIYVQFAYLENAALRENCRLLVDSVLEVKVTLLSGDLSIVHKRIEIIWLF